MLVRGDEKELQESNTVYPWNTMIVSSSGAVKFGDGQSTYSELIPNDDTCINLNASNDEIKKVVNKTSTKKAIKKDEPE